MPRLPTRDDLGGVPSLRPSGGVARVDTTGIGRGIAQAGRLLQDASASLAAQWEADEIADVEARFQAFKFEEWKRLNESVRMADPAQARGFADRTYGGTNSAFGQRASAFLQTVPDRLKKEFDGRLFEVERTSYATALEREWGMVDAAAKKRAGEQIDGTLVPFVQEVAAIAGDDPDAALAHRDEILAGYEQFIQRMGLPPAQAEAYMQQARDKLDVAFAESLPPDMQATLAPGYAVDAAAQQIFLEHVFGVESNNDPEARAIDPVTGELLSSALGTGQVVESTWMELVERHRSDLLEGRTRAEVLDLRRDPNLSRELVTAYAADNANALREAGLPVTAGSLYLAHFLGPTGAKAMLTADPNMAAKDVKGIASGSAASNKSVFFNEDGTPVTVAELIRWGHKKMGSNVVQPDLVAALPGLTADDRTRIANAGAAQISKLYDAQMEEIRARIIEGSFGWEDYNELLSSRFFKGSDASATYTLLEKHQEETNLRGLGLKLIADGASGTPIPHTKGNEDALDAVAKGWDIFSDDSGVRDASVSGVQQMWDATGYVAPDVEAQLVAGAYSEVPETLVQTMSLIDALARKDEAAFESGFSEDIRQRRMLYRSMVGTQGTDAAVRALMPRSPQEEKAIAGRVSEARAEAAKRVTRETVAKRVYPGGFLEIGRPAAPFNPITSSLMADEWLDVYSFQVGNGVNAKTAEMAADAAVAARYQPTTIGSRRHVMAAAPEVVLSNGRDGAPMYRAQALETIVEYLNDGSVEGEFFVGEPPSPVKGVGSPRSANSGFAGDEATLLYRVPGPGGRVEPVEWWLESVDSTRSVAEANKDRTRASTGFMGAVPERPRQPVPYILKWTSPVSGLPGTIEAGALPRLFAFDEDAVAAALDAEVRETETVIDALSGAVPAAPPDTGLQRRLWGSEYRTGGGF